MATLSQSSNLTPYAGLSVDTLKFLGESIAKSGFFNCENAHQGVVMALECIARGTPPLMLAERYNVIKGNLTQKSDSMLAGFNTLGGTHKIVQRDAECASIVLHHRGQQFKASLTWEEVKDESFVKDKHGKIKQNWATPYMRRSMLWARVVSDSIRAFCPQVVAGHYTPEELDGVDDDRGESTQASASPDTPSDDDDVDAVDASFEQVVETQATAYEQTADDVLEESMDGPCEGHQIDEIKSMLEQLEQMNGHADVTIRLKEKLAEAGLDKIADLSFTEAALLESSLAKRNVEAFFDASLTGQSKN